MAYTQIAAEDTDDHGPVQSPLAIPTSPPPSFRSRNSSRRTSRDEGRQSEDERDLDDAFDAPSDDEDDEDARDRRRLIPETRQDNATSGEAAAAAQSSSGSRPDAPQRQVTQIPTFVPAAPSGRMIGNSRDGVWANLSAKPRPGEDVEEKPPTYEQAAADATPPYWETTVLSPYATTGNPDDVFVDGLLVGSLFSFIWNALISMSFQLIGFLLTYLLHTTHAAKHGSRAGLGITLVQYGFQMRYAASIDHPGPDPGSAAPSEGVPDDPNSHDFDPSQVAGADAAAAASTGITTSDWLSYVLMIVGWFILIRAVSDFMKARRQEALVRSSPDRGLGVAVVAENEHPETSV
ncbi:metal homeostasis bsd1 [Lecanosticta acicola]|uniref:Metal homeostasis bsd1 n=1 Tax=Lecanosticta acicola TaxID=111012 RepID=A0AAI8YWV8_9PEZI|nr:metal homeostasis bsd1 [Lecanosticta acicola]